MTENIQKVDPDVKEIKQIVQKYDASAKVKDMGNIVRIISYNQKNTGPVVKELVAKDYSFDYDSPFECPIHIDVRDKINRIFEASKSNFSGS